MPEILGPVICPHSVSLRNLTAANNVCKAAPWALLWVPDRVNVLPKVRLELPFKPDWKIDNGFFNMPITGILKSWYTGEGQEQGFRLRLADGKPIDGTGYQVSGGYVLATHLSTRWIADTGVSGGGGTDGGGAGVKSTCCGEEWRICGTTRMFSWNRFSKNVNSLYRRQCRELELVSALARVRKSESLSQSNVCNLFLPGF